MKEQATESRISPSLIRIKKVIANFNLPTIKRALSLMKDKNKTFVAVILGFCFVELCCTALYTIGIKGVINAITAKDLTAFWLPMSFIMINHLLWWTYAPIATLITEKISKSTMRDFKTNLCEHIIKLPMLYHDNKSTGEILSVISNDTPCLANVYDWSFFQILRSALGGLGGIVIMGIIDWRFAIVVFILGTISVYISSYFGAKLEFVGKEQQERLARTSTDAYELVCAAKTIRLFNIERNKQVKFIETTKNEADIKTQGGKINAKMNAAIVVVNSFSYLAILFVGALFVHNKLSNWGTVIALLSLKGSTDMLFVECGQFMAGMQKSVAGIKRLLAIVDIDEETESQSIVPVNNSNVMLSMEDVTFAYDLNKPVLSNFNLSLEKNSLTAIVGESGSGKSTVMKLILGLYQPMSGKIFFNNCSNTYKSLREITAYVPQQPTLFRGTIYENILFGNPSATYKEVVSAAEMAGANGFIESFENGYQTMLLDNGASLSGGQKQRIAIARALIKNSPILLLDEITSALDSRSEAVVIETVKNISKTKTVLFITHKANISETADKLVRLNYEM